MAGKQHRQGMSWVEVMQTFPDDAAAEAWFVRSRWPEGARCPRCEGENVQEGAKHPTMPYHCRGCRKYFSVKTGTAMEASNLGYQTWALAIYTLTTSLKGVSSMKLHRDLDITQTSAWHLAHRIRKAWEEDGGGPFGGPVEVDEAYIGGLEENKHEWQRASERGERPEKTAVMGAKDRATGQVRAEVIGQVRGGKLRRFARQHTAPGATLYTDGASAYLPLGEEFRHRAVQHSAGTYVIGPAHTNGIESFWSMLKRGYIGTYHRMSPKHLDRYVSEFAGRHNQRPLDTIDQMRAVWAGMVGKRLRYRELTSGA